MFTALFSWLQKHRLFVRLIYQMFQFNGDPQPGIGLARLVRVSPYQTLPKPLNTFRKVLKSNILIGAVPCSVYHLDLSCKSNRLAKAGRSIWVILTEPKHKSILARNLRLLTVLWCTWTLQSLYWPVDQLCFNSMWVRIWIGCIIYVQQFTMKQNHWESAVTSTMFQRVPKYLFH